MFPNKTIFMRSPYRARAVETSEHDYLLVREFITRILSEVTEIQITELVTLGNTELLGKVSGSISWLMLQVKQDMESRAIIKTVRPSGPEKIPSIKLNKAYTTRNRRAS